MANIPDIRFSIIADPRPAAQALKSISQASEQMYLKQKHLAENNAQHIKEIQNKLALDIKRINDKQIGDAKAKIDKITRLEEDASQRIIRIKE